ncbi:MAG TPA: site-specific DNA-methyltransferase [bacterium]|nr:site-specific DNA-methyltransferase [bacterium]
MIPHWNLAITSPPYWGLRNYQLEPVIWDGVEGCEHVWGLEKIKPINLQAGNPEFKREWRERATSEKSSQGQFCQLCGAWRGSLGLEPQFEDYIRHLIQIFDEVKRVLRKDGCLFVNLGDTYSGSGGAHKEHHANPGISHSFERGGVPHEQPCGISGKAKQDYQANGHVSCNPDGGHIDYSNLHTLYISHRPAILQFHEACQKIQEYMVSMKGHFPTLDSCNLTQTGQSLNAIPGLVQKLIPGVGRLLGVLESTKSVFSPLLQADKRLDDCISSFLSILHSFVSYAQEFVHKSALSYETQNYKDDIVSLYGELEHRTQYICEYYSLVSSWLDLLYIKPPSTNKVPNNLPAKSLCQIPSRFAIAMTDAGWILRNHICWYKKNVMPSSVKDRFTVDWESVFFFVKNKKYWFEQQKEGNNYYKTVAKRGQKRFGGNTAPGADTIREDRIIETKGRNKRCVWDVTTKPFKGAHFAVFPPKLIEPMILAGCPENGIVLDIFAGSGTTCAEAKRFNRQYIGMELNSEYIKMAEKRISDTSYQHEVILK